MNNWTFPLPLLVHFSIGTLRLYRENGQQKVDLIIDKGCIPIIVPTTSCGDNTMNFFGNLQISGTIPADPGHGRPEELGFVISPGEKNNYMPLGTLHRRGEGIIEESRDFWVEGIPDRALTLVRADNQGRTMGFLGIGIGIMITIIIAQAIGIARRRKKRR